MLIANSYVPSNAIVVLQSSLFFATILEAFYHFLCDTTICPNSMLFARCIYFKIVFNLEWITFDNQQLRTVLLSSEIFRNIVTCVHCSHHRDIYKMCQFSVLSHTTVHIISSKITTCILYVIIYDQKVGDTSLRLIDFISRAEKVKR